MTSDMKDIHSKLLKIKNENNDVSKEILRSIIILEIDDYIKDNEDVSILGFFLWCTDD